MERLILREIGQNSIMHRSHTKSPSNSVPCDSLPSKCENNEKSQQNLIVSPSSVLTKNEEPQQLNQTFEKENYINDMETHQKVFSENTAENILIPDVLETSTPKLLDKMSRVVDRSQTFAEDMAPINRQLSLSLSKPFDDSLGCLAKNFGSMGINNHSSKADMTFSDDEDFEECRSFNDLSNNIQSHNSFDATVTITNTEHDFDFDDKLKVKRSDESVGSASNINKTVDIQNTEQISNTTVNVSNASSDMLASNYLNQSANLSHNNISNKSTDILPELNHVEIGLTETGDAGWTNSIHEPTLDCDENNGNSENLKIEEPTDTAYRADSLEPDIQYDFSEHTDKTVQNDEPMEQSDHDMTAVQKDTLTELDSVEFKLPSMPITKTKFSMEEASNPFGSYSNKNSKDCAVGENFEDEFKSGSEFQFSGSDFDYLQQFGNCQTEEDIRRDSVLLKFDPLFKQPAFAQQSALAVSRLSIPLEEEEHFQSLNSNFLENINKEKVNPFEEDFVKKEDISIDLEVDSFESENSLERKYPIQENQNVALNEMKDHILETFEHNGNSLNHNNQLDCCNMNESQDSQQQGFKMAELENKIKTEVLKSEDIEKKLKDSELREETLLKRITEKDKTISKMSGVVEAYEKAIAELIAEKEQLVQSYEKKCTDLKVDGEMNAQHLGSLETTFSDLHAKYERTKQVAAELKDREDKLLSEKKQNIENLKMQEMRYEKMKTHAMAQLETANNKLAELTRNHGAELTKLRAQLKKEEISRASTTEQLLQKSKENEELVKICDELINGGQTS